MTGEEAMWARLISFECPQHKRDYKPCWKCGSSLTAKQPDGRYGCPWHWFGTVQLELVP